MTDPDAASFHTQRQKVRVVLGAPAFIKGWLIATTLWAGGVCLIATIANMVFPLQEGSGAEYVLGLAVAVLFYGFGIALVFAAPLAWVLAYALRPVRNQWVHIAAFFTAPTLVFWTLSGLLGIGWDLQGLGLWATAGAAAAVGRWAIRKDAQAVQL